MLGFTHSGSTDWVWFIAEILDWLELRGDYEDYARDPLTPWPHSFIIHDIVRAFVTMAMFFLGLDVTALVTKFVNSNQCEAFRNSLLFDPEQRRKIRPDRRGRTSFKFRNPEFWKGWNEFLKTKKYYADVYPFGWSLAIRPIVARCSSIPSHLVWPKHLTSYSVSGRSHCAGILSK